jgi:hypothetical protein
MTGNGDKDMGGGAKMVGGHRWSAVSWWVMGFFFFFQIEVILKF